MPAPSPRPPGSNSFAPPRSRHSRAVSAARAALASASSVTGTVGRAAHHLRYMPLAMASLGAVIVTLSPGPHLKAVDAVGDDSMAPTLSAGRPVGVDRHAFITSTPEVGQIVTFHPPRSEGCRRRPPRQSACQSTATRDKSGEGIKRIVAGPGDTVALLAGRLIRNGQPVREPYNRRPCLISSICNLPRTVVIPRGTWWLLADNRTANNDSRTYGPIPTAWITGLVEPGS